MSEENSESGSSSRPAQNRTSGSRSDSSGPRKATPPRSGKRPAGDRKPYSAGGKPASGERKPYSKDGKPASSDRKPYSKDGKPTSGDRKPYSAAGRPASSDRKPYSKDGKPASGDRKPYSRDGKPPAGGRPGAPKQYGEKKLWTKDGQAARGDRDRDRNPTYSDRPLTEEELRARELRPVRSRHDDPELPDSVVPADLDKFARMELKTLSKDNAEWVARHLAMAAQLIESDPEQAHLHATSAARRAGRIAIVRETLAITAYATGDYALALRELRTFRRISGSDEEVPLMVDSERGLGRPDRALELGRSIDRSTLSVPTQVSLAIAMSGARLDQGKTDAALLELEIPQLDPTKAFSYSAELFAAYAAVLEDLGRDDEAERWYGLADRAVEALDPDHDDDVIEIVEEVVEIDDIDDNAEGEPDEPATALDPASDE